MTTTATRDDAARRPWVHRAPAPPPELLPARGEVSGHRYELPTVAEIPHGSGADEPDRSW